MSEPTIRVESCRPLESGCWLCGGPRPSPQDHAVNFMLPCGCFWHLRCGEEQSRTRAQHLSNLLTEALRQLSEAQAKLRPVHRVDPGFVIAPEDESNG